MARGLGVNVVGYANPSAGIGEATRQIVAALEAAGVTVAPVELAPPGRLGAAESFARPPRGPHPVNLVCVNADTLLHFAHDLGPGFFAERYTIGLWWWETATFPERSVGAFEHVDEVWVASRFVADAVAAVAPVPVVPIVQPVVVDPPAPHVDRAALGLPAEGFVYLFAFDYRSTVARKNPLGLIEAFTRAFAPGSGASLVLKTINGDRRPEDHARVLAAAAAHPDVHVLDRYLSRDERDALMASCDAYVSLHRSEGFGLTLAEAMALGRPLVGTGYGGVLEFMTPRNSYIVDHALAPIPEGDDLYRPEGLWAEPDLDHAATLMRDVFEDRAEAQRRALRGRADISEQHSLEAAGAAMVQRLARIAGGFRPQRTHTNGGHVFDAASLRDRVASGPLEPLSYRFGRAHRAAREGLLRTLKPYTAHARAVDLELIRGLEAVDRSIAPLVESQRELQARVLELERRLERLQAEQRDAGAAPTDR